MSKMAVEARLGSLTSYNDASTAYDEDKLGLTDLIRQFNGVQPDDKFAGPVPVGHYRPVNTGLAIPSAYPWAMRWSDNIDWVFFADLASATTNRRISMCTYNRSSGEFLLQGAIRFDMPVAGNHTVVGFVMDYQKYYDGTAAVNGTGVEGTSTLWADIRIAAGARIGFGSTDPTAITTWYEISSITDNDTIVLTTNAGVIADGAYVIEELRALLVTTCSTDGNEGLMMAKGLQPAAFTSPATVISASTNVDNLRKTYWLKDNTGAGGIVDCRAAFGCALDTKTSWTEHDFYILDIAANPECFKFNIRAALADLASGASDDACVFKTAAHGAVTGTTSAANNGRIATALHGTGNGLKCLYFTTTTRIYRSAATSTFASGGAWSGDNMTELAPGGATTFAATSTMNSIDYSSILDRFIVSTSNKQYLVKYNTDGSMFERVFTSLNYQLNQSSADGSLAPYVQALAAYYSCWTEGGMLYMAGNNTTAVTNICYAIPIGADWEFSDSTGERLILPKFSTIGATSYTRVYANKVEVIGGDTGMNLGISTEGYKIQYRTSGISDNSGAWTTLDYCGDMSNVPAADEIQFAIIFKTISTTCIAARINSVCLVYEDSSTDSHFQPSAGLSSTTTATFAWRFATALVVPFQDSE